jgi:RNA polymerase sigma factor (sigma-70 family)
VGQNDLSDAQLWEQARSGDGQAFAELFDRHSNKVYNHCFRRTADWSIAEDLTSIVFFEAWRKRKDVRPHDDSLLPWLLGVANNCVRNASRARRRYGRLLAKLPKPEDDPEIDAEASARVDAEREMRHILEVLTQLSSEDREVLALCDFSGLSYEEAAMALALPIGTVKSRLSRAHGRLRGVMTSADTPRDSPRRKGDRNP